MKSEELTKGYFTAPYFVSQSPITQHNGARVRTSFGPNTLLCTSFGRQEKLRFERQIKFEKYLAVILLGFCHCKEIFY